MMSGYTDESARMDELAKAVLLAKQSSYMAHRHVPDRQVKKELEDALSQVNFATHFAVFCPSLRVLRCSARYGAFASVEIGARAACVVMQPTGDWVCFASRDPTTDPPHPSMTPGKARNERWRRDQIAARSFHRAIEQRNVLRLACAFVDVTVDEPCREEQDATAWHGEHSARHGYERGIVAYAGVGLGDKRKCARGAGAEENSGGHEDGPAADEPWQKQTQPEGVP